MRSPPWIERHARTFVIVALALTLAGIMAALSLPVGLFPQVSFPRVVVDLEAGDRPADQMALLVTRPVEEAIRTVPGVVGLRSETSRGSAQISVDFGWGRDMTASTLLVDAAISRAIPALPPGTSYDVRRMDPTVFPILSYALHSDRLSPVELRDLAQYTVVPLLATVPGLARVDVQGGETAEIEVETDPHRLAAHGITLDDVTTAVAGANALQAVGRVQDHNKLYLVVADHAVNGLDALRATLIRNDGGALVRLGDVATVRDGVVPQWVHVAEDGRPAVLFNIYEQPDGNAVAIASQVRSRLAGLALPAGVTLKVWYDQSELVLESAASVRDAVVIGLVLASIVLWLFLRSARVMLVALIAVPATLATTVLLLHVMGMSFNIMTLGGIAAAVGLVIDDVIVMIEQIARRAGARGSDGTVVGASGVYPAAREFLVPLSGSSLATLIVFVPLGFLDGVTGAFSRALSITMACALVVSWLMTIAVVPVLVRRFVDFGRWHDPATHGDGGWWARVHGRLYGTLVQRPWTLVLVFAVPLVAGVVAYAHVSTGFMPQVDESGFVMDYYTAPGTSLPESERQIAQVETILRMTPDVETFSRRLGTGLGGDLGQSYHGDFFVRLKPAHVLSTPEMMNEVRDRIERDVPGMQIETAQLMEDLIGDLTAVPQPIEVKLYGTDPSRLDAQAERVADALSHVAGLVEVKSGIQLAGDALDVRIDAEKAANEGVTPAAVSQAIDAALNGVVATTLPRVSKTVGVRVSMPGVREWRTPDLAALALRAADGHLFPLSRVASIVPQAGQPQITRENLQPMVPVTARIDSGGMSAAVAGVRQALSKPGLLDSGVRYELGGLYQQQQVAFAGLTRVFAAALMAEFILLMFLYRRVTLALIVIGVSLFSITGVFVALWLARVDLNITAMMGLTMIVGIGTEMAIFMISEYEFLARSMPARDALRVASHDRLRPITMTTLAAILTLLPLALAIGQGAGIQQPLAIAIIAGLLVQYPAVLLAMPVLIGLTLPRERD
ncbi:multidrug efflux pump subunit AcrB [Luteibacter sp. Sphag1AF]|uniref:efflux RND transporter permease subunit n=1 Tax=Luteibacter sp. Sphag1AF TaxID=2587031 RepID=UPI00160D2DE5|nr:efflux RND transporter permease subunit [Luteibacter sp. Sphag1AF]MBB3227359.1 multidrug efflux pump subunit AcrB [Luteibacter sp. Sphag1AF]